MATTDELIQAEINKKIQEELRKEKEIEEANKILWQQEKEAIEKENGVLKEEFNKSLDRDLADLPASIRGLVMKMPIKDQIDWIEQYKKDHPRKKKEEKKPSWYEISHKGKKDPKTTKHYPIDWNL